MLLPHNMEAMCDGGVLKERIRSLIQSHLFKLKAWTFDLLLHLLLCFQFRNMTSVIKHVKQLNIHMQKSNYLHPRHPPPPR